MTTQNAPIRGTSPDNGAITLNNNSYQNNNHKLAQTHRNSAKQFVLDC